MSRGFYFKIKVVKLAKFFKFTKLPDGNSDNLAT